MRIVKGKIQFDVAPIIISLFDYSGEWSRHYRENGYRVIQVDIKLGIDILKWDYKAIKKDLVVGVLAAPPCTDFAVSGAQYWEAKDEDGRTQESLKLVHKTLEIVEYFQPVFWAIENPVGRLNKLVPSLGQPYYWQPYEFGDAWTKKTGLWGQFNIPAKKEVEPIKFADQGSWLMLLGGKSERTKELRSMTPKGFSKAFFKANDPYNNKDGKLKRRVRNAA